MLERLNVYFYFVFLLIVYVIAFYFRIYKANIFENAVLHWTHTQSALYFCTLFQFMLGAFALKYRWHDKVSQFYKPIKYPNLFAVLGVILLVVFHGLIHNFIVAPFTALGFIFLFLQLRLGKNMERTLDYFTPHATNLWLIHMFFYLVYFTDIIYAPQYPVLIFGWLVLWCLMASYLVNVIYNSIAKVVFN